MTQDSEDRIAQLEVAVESLLKERVLPLSGPQCGPERPHPNKLSYMRGPNQYLCECGMVYVKDGKGGLKEAP